MPLPNIYIPGQVYFGTRCIQNKAHRLDVEDSAIISIFKYAFGRFATKWNITLHSICIVQNHIHWTCTDNEAKYGQFQADVFRMTSAGYNKENETSGVLWEPNEEPHRVYIEPEDLDTLAEKSAYTNINAERHRFTDDYESWKGLLSPIDQIGKAETVARPTKAFGPRSTMEEEVTLVFEPPRGLSDKEWKAKLKEVTRIVRDRYVDEPLRELPPIGHVPQKKRTTPKALKGKGSRLLRSFAGKRRLKMLAAYLVFLKLYRQAQNAWDPSRPQRLRFPAGTGAMSRLALVEAEAHWLHAVDEALPGYIRRLLKDGQAPSLSRLGFDPTEVGKACS